MTWTRLENTEIWSVAKARYHADPRLKYHVWSHVQRLYFHAENTFGFAYDEQLDRAILGHDVIYDEHPDKELRSAKWLLDYDLGATMEAHEHIMRTAGHRPGTDNRILLLDLADFMIKDRIASNRELIEQESMVLYGISRQQFAKANASFLEDMVKAYTPEALADYPDWEAQAFREISRGIEASAKISRDILASGAA